MSRSRHARGSNCYGRGQGRRAFENMPPAQLPAEPPGTRIQADQVVADERELAVSNRVSIRHGRPPHLVGHAVG